MAVHWGGILSKTNGNARMQQDTASGTTRQPQCNNSLWYPAVDLAPRTARPPLPRCRNLPLQRKQKNFAGFELNRRSTFENGELTYET
jgi:hypothetical protein